MKTGRVIVVAVAAAAVALLAACGAEKGAEAGTQGGRTAKGTAECVLESPDVSYPVYVEVETDSEGKITAVKDAGSTAPGSSDKRLKKAQEIFDSLIGKTVETIGETDVVSGATYSSQAYLTAVEEALKEIG